MPTHGRFLVTAAAVESAVLQSLASSQIHTLAENPGLERFDVVEATLEPAGELGVRWTIEDLEDQWAIDCERVEEAPAEQAIAVAEELASGEAETIEDSETVAWDVLCVPPEKTESEADDVLTGESPISRGARLGATRVELRATAGVLDVRYLND